MVSQITPISHQIIMKLKADVRPKWKEKKKEKKQLRN